MPFVHPEARHGFSRIRCYCCGALAQKEWNTNDWNICKVPARPSSSTSPAKKYIYIFRQCLVPALPEGPGLWP